MSLNSQDWTQIAATAVSMYTGGAYGAAAGSAGRGGGVFGAPSNAQSSGFSGGIGSGLDSSGWAVNFRGTQTATSSPTRVTDYSDAQMPGAPQQAQPPVVRVPDRAGLPFVGQPGQVAGQFAGIGGNNLTWVALGVLGLAVVWRLKKSK